MQINLSKRAASTLYNVQAIQIPDILEAHLQAFSVNCQFLQPEHLQYMIG